MNKFIYLVLMLFVFSTLANDEEVLIVDRTISNNIQFSFPNDNNIKPKAGDFEIINYVLMSNETGERWSVITLTNSSTGSRILDQEHLMGLFADGSRMSPLEYKLNFKGKETQSVTVSFGQNKFPILNIYSNN